MSFSSDFSGSETFDELEQFEQNRVASFEREGLSPTEAHLATTAAIAMSTEERNAHTNELHKALSEQGID